MPAAKSPPYLRIVDQLRREVVAGQHPGRLPSEPELAERFAISRMTLRRAIAVLVQEGFLEVRLGAGTFVRQRAGGVGARTVGLVSPLLTLDTHDPFLRHLTHALLVAGAERAWTLRLAPDPAALRRRSAEPELAACIAAAFAADQLGQLADPPAPLVLVDSAPLPEVPAILPDNAGGIAAALDALTTLGHRRIVHLAGPVTAHAAQERLAAFTAGLALRGLVRDERSILPGWFRPEDGAAAMATWWNSASERPTAVLCANDHMAVGVLGWCAEQGLRPGRDLSVVGFDGLDLARATWPPLATCAVDFPAHAALVLAAVVDGIPGIRRSSVTLVPRQTLGPAPGQGP